MRFVHDTASGRPLVAPEPIRPGDPAFPISKCPPFETPPLNESFNFSKDLQSILDGKQLLLDELSFPIDLLHEHYLNGHLTYKPGIVEEKGQFSCKRCGNHTPRLFGTFACSRCGDQCMYCRKCIMMGRVSQCAPLISWTGSSVRFPKRENVLAWRGELSPAQKRGSKEIVNATGTNTERLVWAVCGAGKTEVLFEGIAKALQNGMRVCIASPRTDVIFELAPRLNEAFPDVETAALYGGSEEKQKQAQLVLATTHQLIRFANCFDVVVIDEVDAFPYNMDEMLRYGVQRAKKTDSTVIYLTATPDNELKQRYRNGQLKGITIPLRYHGRPLPVPELRWAGNWKKALRKNKFTKTFDEWCKRQLASDRQAFLFVPSVDVLKQVTAILQKRNPQIEGVHAEDSERREKVESFRSGQVPIIVTTTILERGVTVQDVDVAVFGADEDIFSESALVQIAGRAGRSAQHPNGEVIFFHYGKTKAMVDARLHIEGMNQEGEAMSHESMSLV